MPIKMLLKFLFKGKLSLAYLDYPQILSKKNVSTPMYCTNPLLLPVSCYCIFSNFCISYCKNNKANLERDLPIMRSGLNNAA